MPAIIFSVPSGLPQEMQLTTTASLITRGCRASGASDSRGVSVMAFSGHVAAQRPHCTHFDLDERELRRLLIVENRAFGTGADAREAHRAGVAVDHDRAERRAGGQRDLPLRHRRMPREVVDRERSRRALVGGEREGRGTRTVSAGGHDHSAGSSASGSAPSTTRRCLPW